MKKGIRIGTPYQDVSLCLLYTFDAADDLTRLHYKG